MRLLTAHNRHQGDRRQRSLQPMPSGGLHEHEWDDSGDASFRQVRKNLREHASALHEKAGKFKRDAL